MTHPAFVLFEMGWYVGCYWLSVTHSDKQFWNAATRNGKLLSSTESEWADSEKAAIDWLHKMSIEEDEISS